MASTGFAGGLAEGINNAMQLHMQNRNYGALRDARERGLDLREQALEARTAKAEGGGGSGSKGGDYDGFEKALMPIFAAKPQQAAPVAPVANPAGLGGNAPTTLPDAGLMAQNPAAAYQEGGLATVAPPQAQAAPAQAEEPINPRHQIVKEMMFGNLANEPQKLDAIVAAAAMHGLGDKIQPWVEGLYKAKKTGLFDASMDLKRGNVDGAIENLKRGGINLEDRPVKVKPDDPNDSQWKVNISGSGEQTIDLDAWATSALDPEKYSKFINDRQTTADKGKVANAQADSHTANAEESRAKAKLYGAGGLTAASRGGGGKGGGSAGPTVRKTVETDQGIVAIMSDGSKRMISDDSGKPMFGTSNQKIAAGLVGKTLDPLSDNTDIAGRVNTMAGQLRGKSAPAPTKIKELPEGAKLIGTSKGKLVYEHNGKRFVGD